MKKYKFLINGISYNVNVKGIEEGVADVSVNGTSYSVNIESEEVKTNKTPKLVRKEIERNPGENKAKTTPVPSTKRPSSKTIKSPLPGNVIKVLVNEGDTFAEGDVLMVMESMKMENNIQAEKSGKIVKVCTAPGASVLQDDVIFEYE